jgi:HEPN domain-containing protein
MSNGDAPEWIRHAEADLRYAQLGRQEPGMLLNLVAFHAQQATEKALKALLVADQVDFPRTHDLGELLALLRQTGRRRPAGLEQVEELTPLAVQTRYPGFDDPVEEAEADEAIRLASETLVWVKAELGLT